MYLSYRFVLPRSFDSEGQSIAPFIHSYIDAGIKYIGGCCNINPSQIRVIRDIIDKYTS
jgi:S-methylmethionine-dependent homocysteine/selenocysteine methylase